MIAHVPLVQEKNSSSDLSFRQDENLGNRDIWAIATKGGFDFVAKALVVFQSWTIFIDRELMVIFHSWTNTAADGPHSERS